MNPPSLIQFLSDLYVKGPRDQSLLILGPPGVGKSEAVLTAAKNIASSQNLRFWEYRDNDEPPDDAFIFLDLRLTEVDPADLIGVPQPLDGGVAYKPLKWAQTLSRKPGLLFLDEFTNVQDDSVLAAAFKLVLDRSAGFVKLSPQVMIIAAGNTSEHSSIARPLPSPLINRLMVLELDPPSLEGWFDYMRSKDVKIPDPVIAYLISSPSSLTEEPHGAEGLENYSTPRSWERFCRIVSSLQPPYALIKEIAEGLFGPRVGPRVSAFFKLNVPSIQTLMISPGILDDLPQEAVLLAATTLGRALGEGTVKAEDAVPLVETLSSRGEEFLMAILFGAGSFKDRVRVGLTLSKKSQKVKEIISRISKFMREVEG